VTKNINVLGRPGRFKKLRSVPPAGAKAKSVMTLEARVENRPQELRKLRSSFALNLSIPGYLSDQAQIVLKLLFECFHKANSVQEGLIGDLIWGFAQNKPPIPQELTIDGLRALELAGYVKFQAKDGSFVSFDSDKVTGAFVRYQPKLMDLVYEVNKT
jgi:hypothetical protein